MLQGLNLIASVAFETHRGGVNGQCELADEPRHHAATLSESFASRSYRCLVSGSTQTGSGAAVAAGRYSCILGAGNDDISVASLITSWNVCSASPGGATDAGFLKIVRTAPSVFEVDIYTIVANVPALSDAVGGAFPWQVNVAWFRLDPA